MRPTLWQIARQLGVVGSVWNQGDKVMIHLWCTDSQLHQFIDQLKKQAPGRSHIERIDHTRLDAKLPIPSDFTIATSKTGSQPTQTLPDLATCSDCLAELRDPFNRRFGYPFINCTQCGPRYSIVRQLPYDRANTSMAKFELCSRCLKEYQDPTDRRFHAQPNACPECGPSLWLEDSQGQVLCTPPPNDYSSIFDFCCAAIRAGNIIAIKSIGGFHLACDATNEAAVGTLRTRKRRPGKALALMAANLEIIRHYAQVNEQQAISLSDPAAPIVILPRRTQSPPLAANIAPDQDTLGFMLPGTALHTLLVDELETPIVMTSGNSSGAAPCISNSSAREKLQHIADFFLMHDRDIINRVDDSVVRHFSMTPASPIPITLRRARGYAPKPVSASLQLNTQKNILAMGGELKNTFTLITQGKAIVSQHIGDLKQSDHRLEYQHQIQRFLELYRVKPDLIVTDLHPDYASTRLGIEHAAALNIPYQAVQHHHAHIASVMYEWGINPEQTVLGIALDGLGLGQDHALWGGEFLQVSYCRCDKLAGFRPVPLLGNHKAMQEPWRNCLAHLLSIQPWEHWLREFADLEIIQSLSKQPIKQLTQMHDHGLNSPKTSSAGRLFDAVAAALGLGPESQEYEAQAAIKLESLALRYPQKIKLRYPFNWNGNELDWRPLWPGLLRDLQQNQPTDLIAAKFINTFTAAIATAAKDIANQYQLETIAFGGGVFQNTRVLENLYQTLSQDGFQVIYPLQVPPNDGGLSLGQAVIGTFTIKNPAQTPYRKCADRQNNSQQKSDRREYR